jgi:hypothetical protein
VGQTDTLYGDDAYVGFDVHERSANASVAQAAQAEQGAIPLVAPSADTHTFPQPYVSALAPAVQTHVQTPAQTPAHPYQHIGQEAVSPAQSYAGQSASIPILGDGTLNPYGRS